MPLSIKAVSAKVAAELVGEDVVEMVANHHHLPTVSDVLLHITHILQDSSDPPDEGDTIREP